MWPGGRVLSRDAATCSRKPPAPLCFLGSDCFFSFLPLGALWLFDPEHVAQQAGQRPSEGHHKDNRRQRNCDLHLGLSSRQYGLAQDNTGETRSGCARWSSLQIDGNLSTTRASFQFFSDPIAQVAGDAHIENVPGSEDTPPHPSSSKTSKTAFLRRLLIPVSPLPPPAFIWNRMCVRAWSWR